jgi:hypothetical protein
VKSRAAKLGAANAIAAAANAEVTQVRIDILFSIKISNLAPDLMG